MAKNNLVIAVDFDGTLEDGGQYPIPGDPNYDLISILRAAQSRGNRLILYTCRTGDDLAIAVNWCKSLGLVFDAVNENLPDKIEHHNNDCRKIGADIYIDDRAIHPRQVTKYWKKEEDFGDL